MNLKFWGSIADQLREDTIDMVKDFKRRKEQQGYIPTIDMLLEELEGKQDN